MLGASALYVGALMGAACWVQVDKKESPGGKTEKEAAPSAELRQLDAALQAVSGHVKHKHSCLTDPRTRQPTISNQPTNLLINKPTNQLTN
jgi:hypothetical protein